jgi:uncharacterized repeat protein (TIGR01451 family)
VRNDPIPQLNLGDIVVNTASITQILSDYDLANNIFVSTETAQGAYDPNDKNESHNGTLTTAQASDQDWLYYLIRFQNTGTDTAFNIKVRDTLDNNLDFSSLQMIDASHDQQLSILGDKHLQWDFDDILLVDSLTNEPLSHGYIYYRIKPVAGLILGDMIENSASIYFDFNPPIVTNNHITTVSDDRSCLSCINNALHFDGIDDYIQSTSPLNGDVDYTIEAWFQSENTSSSDYHRIIGFTNFEFEIADANGVLQFYDGQSWQSTGLNIRDNQWHHVAVTRSGSQYIVLVGGNELLNYSSPHIVNFTGDMFIGKRFGPTLELWNGKIDEVRIWDNARSN